MARDLVALKFNAGIHTVDTANHKMGHAKYPDFNKVPSAIRKGMDWCSYIDTFGIGMQYDKCCGHKEAGETPFGEQSCVIAVPADFADAAMVALPGELTELTVKEFETFYDTKAHAHESLETIDKEVIDAIAQKESLGLPVPEKADAVDVKSNARGIRKNHNKFWVDKKVKAGVVVLDRKTLLGNDVFEHNNGDG
jgi:hypothetical protein